MSDIETFPRINAGSIVGKVVNDILSTDNGKYIKYDHATGKLVMSDPFSGITVLNLKGVIDCSANPNYPAATIGDFYIVSVAGKIGGASGANVQAMDMLICKETTIAGTQAAVGSKWGIAQGNIHTASDLAVDASGFTGNLGVADTDVQKALDTIDGLAVGGGSPVYIPIPEAASNEIEFLVTDAFYQTVANQGNFGCTVTVTNGTNYTARVYGASEALIATYSFRSGVEGKIPIPKGTGYPTTTGFESWRIRVSSETPANEITAVTLTAAAKELLYKARLGTTGLTTLSTSFQNCYYLMECKLPATLAALTTMANCFNACYNLTTLTLPTSASLCTDYSSTFNSCYLLTSITIPSDSTGITTLANCFNACYNVTSITLPATLASCTILNNAFKECYKITTISLPATMNALTSMYEIVNGCRALTSLTLPTSMTGITGNNYSWILDTEALTTLSECTTYSTNQLTLHTNKNTNLAVFNQSSMRVAKLDLAGVNADQKNKFTSIDIDYANSTYGGSAPQLDFRFNELDATELDRIFTALPSVAKTISIVGNPGIAGCNTAIATAKGWTVTVA